MRRQKRIGPPKGAGRSLPRLKPTDELDWDVINKELRKYFNLNPDGKNAKRALAELIAAGCEEEMILQNLYLFCGGDPHAMQSLRDDLDLDRCQQRMLAIAELAKKTSSEIEVAEQLLADLGLSRTGKPDVSSLRRYAHLLQRVGEAAYQLLTSRKISGRDQHLVYLSRLIDADTGRPHYRQLADLVNGTRLLYDPHSTKVETALAVRRRVSRYGRLDIGSELELIERKRMRASRLNT